MHKRYMLKSCGLNGCVIGYFDTLIEVQKAYDDFSIKCNGDWTPQLREWDPKKRMYVIIA